MLERAGRRFHKMAPGIEASKIWFEKYGSLSVIIARVLPLCRTYISFIAGVSRQRIVKFLSLSVIGISVWNLVLVGLGFKLADNFGVITEYASKYSYFLFPVVLLLVFFIICRIMKTARNLNK